MLIHNTSKVGDILISKLDASSWKLRNTFIEAAVKAEKFTVEDLLTDAMKDDIVRNNTKFEIRDGRAAIKHKLCSKLKLKQRIYLCT